MGELWMEVRQKLRSETRDQKTQKSLKRKTSGSEKNPEKQKRENGTTPDKDKANPRRPSAKSTKGK